MAPPRRSLLGRMLRRLLFVGAVTGAVAAARDWAIRRNDARTDSTPGAAPPE